MERRPASAGAGCVRCDRRWPFCRDWGRPVRAQEPPCAGYHNDQCRHPQAERRSVQTAFGRGRRDRRRSPRLGGSADVQRIDSHRLEDVLEPGRPEIGHRQIEPPPDLAISVLGKTDRAWRGDAFQSRGDVDAVAHEIAVALLDDVAQMNADPELDALIRRDARVAFDHGDRTSIAQRTASTTLRNSAISPSPVRLTRRPLCTEIVGSIRSLRSARSRARVRSSSAPASRL